MQIGKWMIINAFFVVNKVSHITKFVEGRRNVTQGESGYENVGNNWSTFSPRSLSISPDPLAIWTSHHTASLSGQWAPASHEGHCLGSELLALTFQNVHSPACCHLSRLLTLGIISTVEFAAAPFPSRVWPFTHLFTTLGTLQVASSLSRLPSVYWTSCLEGGITARSP